MKLYVVFFVAVLSLATMASGRPNDDPQKEIASLSVSQEGKYLEIFCTNPCCINYFKIISFKKSTKVITLFLLKPNVLNTYKYIVINIYVFMDI